MIAILMGVALSDGRDVRAPQADGTSVLLAGEFFPLKPGVKRVYEQKGEGTVTLIDEVGTKPAYFDDTAATPILQKSQFNQVLSTQYYRVEGPTVFLVGTAEDRVSDATAADGTVDFSKPRVKHAVLMQLLPKMPIFRYEGRETAWSYGEVQYLKGAGDTNAIKTDETAIKGVTRPVGTKEVLGRKVEAIEVRAEVQLGQGNLAEKIVETSVYGRGIGLIESSRKNSGGGKKPSETRMRLVAIEESKGEG